VNLSAAGVAGALALGGGGDLIGLLREQPAAGIPYLGFVGIGAVLTALLLSELPAVGVRRTT
jgi:hypothetical protein